MTKEAKCPICGKINERTYYTAEIGLVEDYYYCDNCGYGIEMCYSPTRQYIDLNRGWDFDEIKKVWSRTKERSEKHELQ